MLLHYYLKILVAREENASGKPSRDTIRKRIHMFENIGSTVQSQLIQQPIEEVRVSVPQFPERRVDA